MLRCVTQGEEKYKKKEQAENIKFKKTLWRENYKEIRSEMDKLSKVKDLKMPTTERERNYLIRMNMLDARVWFRY